MTRRATVTQAEVTRAIRAAKQAGAAAIHVQRDGTIAILLETPPIIPTDDPFELWKRDRESAKVAGRR